MAADEAQLKAVERLEAMEHEAAELAQRMAGLLHAALAKCRGQGAEGEAAGRAARDAAVTARRRVQECQEELDAARQALAQQRQGEDGGSGSSQGSKVSLLKLQQRVAAAEEEVTLVEEATARRQQLAAQLEAAAAEVARLEAARTAAAAELAACQQAQRRMKVDLQLAGSAADAVALRASLAAEERRLAAAVFSKQSTARAASSRMQETAARLAELSAEQQRLAAAQQAAATGSDAASSIPQVQAALRAREQQLRALLQPLRQQEQSLAAEAGTLAARLARVVGTPPTPPDVSAAWRPLHQCFAFREPQGCSRYAEALAVLAGRKLGVLVADSLAEAGRLLASAAGARGGGARIWPLDALAAEDHSERQRRAAAAFPAGTASVEGRDVA